MYRLGFRMNFIDALRKCDFRVDRLRSHIVDTGGSIVHGVKIYRPVWREIDYPVKFVWVSRQNIPMASVGDGQSMPLLLEVPDFLADDWEVL